MRIGVLGAGAIGCYLGGRLQAAGHDVVLVGRARIGEELAKHGLVLTDYTGARVVVAPGRVRFATDPAALRECDAVLVTVKSLATESAAAPLAAILARRTTIVSFQNGVSNAPRLRAVLPGHDVRAGMVPFNVAARGEGVFHNGTSGPLGVESPSRREEPIARALRDAGFAVETHADLLPVQWSKLLFNLNNSINALAGVPLREQLTDRGYRHVLAACMAEGLQVVRAAGIRPARVGRLIPRVAPFVLRLPDALFFRVASAMVKIDPHARSSMLDDLDHGRATEIDYLNGEILRLAAASGLRAPANQAIHDLVKRAEAVKAGSPRLSSARAPRRPPSGLNMKRFNANLLVLALAAVSCQSPSSSSSSSTEGSGSSSAPADAGSSSSGGDAASAPDGHAQATSAPVTLGFASATFTMYASIGGGPAHLVQLDTGLLGLYVPKSVLGAAAQVSATETCSITYVSSGTTLSGHAATAAVALLGASKAGDVSPPPTTVAMSLCAIDDPTFTGGMMGVGFGRTTPGDPSRNVILQLQDAVSGAVRAGWVLGTHPAPHVTLGLDAATAAGFQTLTLSPDPGGSGDWLASSLHGCLSLPNDPGFGMECGPLLVDTGIAESLLWGPKDPTLGGTIPSGQTSVPNGVAVEYTAGAALAYSFVVGQAPGSPSYVGVRTASAFSINTGRALLVDDDYLFDAVAGTVGFRPAGP